MSKPSNSKVTLVAIFIVPVAALVFAFFGIGIINRGKTLPIAKEVKPGRSPKVIFSGVDLEVEDFAFTEYVKVGNEIEKSFVMSGKQMQTANPKFGIFRIAVGKVLEIKDPKITFYRDNLPIARAGANRASMDPINKNIGFYGSASLITKDGKMLTCNRLKWNNKDMSLISEGASVLKADGKIINAERIRTDVQLKDYTVSDQDRRLLTTVAAMFTGGTR